jgi:hypothetical protein
MIHYQTGMVCLKTEEFDKLMNLVKCAEEYHKVLNSLEFNAQDRMNKYRLFEDAVKRI